VTAPTALYRIPDAMQALNLSRSKIYELIKAGRLRTVKEGRARLVPAAAIDEYANLLVTEAAKGRQ
jgi:excisionase family DNA binding protein